MMFYLNCKWAERDSKSLIFLIRISPDKMSQCYQNIKILGKILCREIPQILPLSSHVKTPYVRVVKNQNINLMDLKLVFEPNYHTCVLYSCDNLGQRAISDPLS